MPPTRPEGVAIPALFSEGSDKALKPTVPRQWLCFPFFCCREANPNVAVGGVSQPSWNLTLELTYTQPTNLILPHNRILRIMSLFFIPIPRSELNFHMNIPFENAGFDHAFQLYDTAGTFSRHF